MPAAAYPDSLVQGDAPPISPSIRQGADATLWVRRPGIRVQSTPALTRSQARVYSSLAIIWIGANVLFWSWWLEPERVGSIWMYILMSIALAYDATLLPSAYLFFLGRMRHPRPFVAPPGLRVALITLCVPSHESSDVIRAQLEAMVRVRYPHDSWVLDEGNDPTVRDLASELGVRYFTRAGIDRYNQSQPPFKARTKAGNVNAWLDAHGSNYEFFVQFDIDHHPEPEYLHRVLGYFHDQKVAWVQAPSVYGNLDNWVARGAAEQELVLQGPLQRGFFGHSETPFIIGSHCTYRMSAVREIGGFAPTRAEDHLDTMLLASRGYRGVFVPEIIARGLGPDTFETYVRQQFAWAVSMIQVLVGYTPRMLRRLGPGRALQFLFAETWYPLFGLSMLVLFLIPVAALVADEQPARVSLIQFVVASAPLQLTALGVWWWSRRWQTPSGLGLSWRGVVLHIARWPIVLWALINVLLRVRHPYMITPKNGRDALPGFGLSSQLIYLAAATISMGAVWLSLIRGGDPTRGYIVFAVSGAMYMLLVVMVNVIMDQASLRRYGLTWNRAIRLRLVPLTVAIGALAGVGYTTVMAAPLMLAAASWTETVSASGVTPGTGFEPAVLPAEAAPAPSGITEPMLVPGEVSVGAYDPSGALAGLPLTIEQSYVPQSSPTALSSALVHAGTTRIPLVTLEPLPADGDGAPVLERVASGQADDELIRLADVVRDEGPPVVLVRWAHEMDLNLLYPWSSNEPDLYRAAFRHVADVFRTEGATNVRWVWSPAGQGNALAFYPGGDVVDYIGLTVLGDAGWDAELGYTTRQSMADILQPRYFAVAPADKPIIIAELGVSGTAAEQAAWLSDGAQALGEFPGIQAIVYFNDQNAANNWRVTQPDWRLKDPRALEPLLGVRPAG